MKIDLTDFVSIEEREQLVENLLSSKDSVVEVDARKMKRAAGDDDYDQLLVSIKFMAERLRSYGRQTPTIKFFLPEDHFVLDLKRVDELRRVSGIDIELTVVV